MIHPEARVDWPEILPHATEEGWNRLARRMNTTLAQAEKAHQVWGEAGIRPLRDFYETCMVRYERDARLAALIAPDYLQHLLAEANQQIATEQKRLDLIWPLPETEAVVAVFNQAFWRLSRLLDQAKILEDALAQWEG